MKLTETEVRAPETKPRKEEKEMLPFVTQWGTYEPRRSSRRRRLLTGKRLERERQFRQEKGNLRSNRSVGRRRRH